MGKLIATRGLPGCGKSTWAKGYAEVLRSQEKTVARVNRDLLRTMLHFNEWSKANEKLTVEARDLVLVSLMTQGIYTVICDDTNLDPKVMGELHGLAKAIGYEFEIKNFTDVPLHVCIDRDAKREGYARVGSKVIMDMHNKYLNYARKTDESN